MVEKHGVMFEILHKLNTFDPIRYPGTSDIILILLSMFFSCPHNYPNEYDTGMLGLFHTVSKQGHHKIINENRILQSNIKQG